MKSHCPRYVEFKTAVLLVSLPVVKGSLMWHRFALKECGLHLDLKRVVVPDIRKLRLQFSVVLYLLLEAVLSGLGCFMRLWLVVSCI